jgi:hypothetical protein
MPPRGRDQRPRREDDDEREPHVVAVEVTETEDERRGEPQPAGEESRRPSEQAGGEGVQRPPDTDRDRQRHEPGDERDSLQLPGVELRLQELVRVAEAVALLPALAVRDDRMLGQCRQRGKHLGERRVLGCQAELAVSECGHTAGQVVLLVVGGGVAPGLHEPEGDELNRQQREHRERHPPADRHGGARYRRGCLSAPMRLAALRG